MGNVTTVTATLGGIRLDWQDLSEERKLAVVRHEYPGQNGADLESQGWTAAEHKLKVVFLADRQADWHNLEAVLFTGAVMVLEHPSKGRLNGLVESVSIKHDDRRDTVEVDITFVEDGFPAAPVYRPSAIDVASSLYAPIARDAGGVCAEPWYPYTPPSPDLTDPSWLEKLGNLGNTLNALVGVLRGQLSRLDSIIASITSPISSVLFAIEWASDLPSQLTKRLAIVLDLLHGKIEGAPSPALAAKKFLADAKALAETFSGTSSEGTARIMVANQGALTVAGVMAGDEARLRAMRAYETTQAFDTEGRWVARGGAPAQLPATAIQIEALVADARALIQAARPWVTDPADLDRLALALQDSFRSRLIEFEQLREIMVLAPTPMHVICHQYGLAYNVAERLCLLNNVRNPSFVQGKILIYAA